MKEKLGRELGFQYLKDEERKSHRRLQERRVLIDRFLFWRYARKSRDYVTIYSNFETRSASTQHMKTVKYHRDALRSELFPDT